MITDEYCMDWLRAMMARGETIVFDSYNGRIAVWCGIGYGGVENKLAEGATLSDAFERATNGWMR